MYYVMFLAQLIYANQNAICLCAWMLTGLAQIVATAYRLEGLILHALTY